MISDYFSLTVGRLGAAVAGTIRVLLAAIPKLSIEKGDSK